MARVETAHTADLDGATLAAARSLLDEVFGDELDDSDWEHALGGVHVLAWEAGRLVGHASVVQRRLLHRGGALRTGYVEAVAVVAERRRRGLGRELMAAAERVVRGAYDLGALAATDQALAFYEACGWLRWRGVTSALTPTGIVRTPDADGCVFVLPAGAVLDMDGELTCDWRDGDVW